MAGHLPHTGAVTAEERRPIAREEGYDPLAIELALQPAASTVGDKLGLVILTLAATFLVMFFFPFDRFFKPKAKALGLMTIGGPTIEAHQAQFSTAKERHLKVLLEIDRLYFREGQLTQALQLAKLQLEQAPAEDWEKWQKVHYRYWELLSAAGRIAELKTASGAYLKIRPEDPFANYYYAQAFLAATDPIPSFTKQTRQTYRQEALDVVAQIDRACNALTAQRRHPAAKEREATLAELYQKLKLEQAKTFVFIWRSGGYKEDRHPDVVFRDKALDICESDEIAGRQEAQKLKAAIYTRILERWYWFEGPQEIQGTQHRRKDIAHTLELLKSQLKDSKAS
ncbi:MAG: hypothetical protein JSW39_01490 [Desulfobacterales bacterium]|nr:MAG: hypothetical protein JSW39_01490 [Desulfobacterales bacterium]